MAHAGTPTDLAQKPATSTTGLWQALLAVIVVLAIGAGMVFVASNLASSKSVAAPVVTSGRQFDQAIPDAAGPFSDGSYTQIESNRGGALSGTPGATKTILGGSAPDYGNGKVRGHRGAMISQ